MSGILRWWQCRFCPCYCEDQEKISCKVACCWLCSMCTCFFIACHWFPRKTNIWCLCTAYAQLIFDNKTPKIGRRSTNRLLQRAGSLRELVYNNVYTESKQFWTKTIHIYNGPSDEIKYGITSANSTTKFSGKPIRNYSNNVSESHKILQSYRISQN